MSVCLFCRGDLQGIASVEHVIPHTLGGWITTDQVCKPCNERLGHEVEKVAGYPLLLTLRQEAGLPIGSSEEWDLYDVQADDVVPGRLTPDGKVEPISPVYRGENRILVRGEPEEVERIIEKMRSRSTDAPAPQLKRLEPPERHFVRLHKSGGSQPDWIELLCRASAKIVLEYVAIKSSPDVALSPDLDYLRDVALDGTRLETVGFVYRGPSPLVRMPNLGRVLHFEVVEAAREQERRRIVEEQELPPLISSDPPAMDQFPTWPPMFHRMKLVREGDLAYGLVR